MYNDLSGHCSRTKGVKSRYQTKRKFIKIIHLKKFQSRNTKVEIEIGNTMEYDRRSYQVKNNIVKITEVK